MKTILVLLKQQGHDGTETAWLLSWRRTLKGDYLFLASQFRKTLTMLSIGFRAQIYPPVLQDPTGCTHSQPTSWDRSPPFAGRWNFWVMCSQRIRKILKQTPWKKTQSLLTQQYQQPKYLSSLSNHRNNQPLCTAADCPAWVHASSQRRATTTQQVKEPGPSPTSHQPQGSCWASSNLVPGYHSNSFTLYSVKLIKF